MLVEGLPKGRMFNMYRKYRKMGTMEVLACVSLIATVAHYLFRWTAYLEKKFELVSIALFIVVEMIARRIQKSYRLHQMYSDKESCMRYLPTLSMNEYHILHS